MNSPRSKSLRPLQHALAALLLLGGVAIEAHAGTFIPGLEDIVSSAPARAPRASRRAARPVAPKPDVAPAAEPADDVATAKDAAQSEVGKPCAGCEARRQARVERKVPVKRIAGMDPGSKYHSAQEACYSQAIFEAAKRNEKRRYNRTRSKGQCAVGVRGHLGAAGVYGGYALAESAIEYNSKQLLRGLGFENFASEYKSPEDAPKGAILVFAGPKSHEFTTNGRKIYGGNCRISHGRRKCSDAGNWAGHITVAGESRGAHNRWYYTDGRTPQPAVGWPRSTTKRRLVGVWLMQKCTGQCSPALRARCGG